MAPKTDADLAKELQAAEAALSEKDARIAELEQAAATAAEETKTRIADLEQKLAKASKQANSKPNVAPSRPSGEFVELDFYGDGPYSGTDPENGQPVNAQPGDSVIVSAKKAAQLLADFPCDFAPQGEKPEKGDSAFTAEKAADEDEG